jgi:hypothetical protein
MTFAKLAITRRVWARMLVGAALGGVLRGRIAGDTGGGDRLNWGAEPSTDTGKERRYRVDAQILLILLPLVRWANVGGGSVVVRETTAPGRGMLKFLEFTGFSRPERAAGLNRLGFLRELSRVAEDGAAEFLYFGLMTASPEETAEAARKALHSTAKEITYTAIDGRLAAREAETVVAQFASPAQWSFANRSELVQHARLALSAATSRPSESGARRVGMRPFLHALADALREPGPTETQFVYGARLYHLWLQKSADSKEARYFREHGLISASGNVVRVTGQVRREGGDKESKFRLWIEEAAAQPLPLRIEYQAKSYLRLIFEAEA